MLPPADLARYALESAPDATVIADSAGLITYVNHQVTAIFGYEPEELIGRRIEELMPERYRSRHVSHREAFVAQPRARAMGAGLELHGRRKDGSEFPVEISLSPIRRGPDTFTAAAIRDVTDRTRIMAELVAAREEANRANAAKSRFLTTASHDLRQPLQALSLLNGTLRRVATARHLTEPLAQQENAISAMSRLINALLDISKLESGAIKPEITDFKVATLFEEMRTEFAGLANAKGLTLQVESCAEGVRSDAALVGQILRNLTANAIKYTRTGVVALRCLRERALVRLEVRDTGIGITADHLPHIFDEFYQVGVAPNAARDGYGLGLSIVTRLVKLLDLKLDVRSELGKGSVFSVTLPESAAYRPAQRDTGASRASAEADATQPQRRRVLLVDDDDGVRKATRLLLEIEGYEVWTATSPMEALREVGRSGRPDLLITDYHLGCAETGLDIIVSLRQQLGAALDAILMTGDTSPSVKGLVLDEHIRVASKPIDPERLLAMMTELLGNSGAARLA